MSRAELLAIIEDRPSANPAHLRYSGGGSGLGAGWFYPWTTSNQIYKDDIIVVNVSASSGNLSTGSVVDNLQTTYSQVSGGSSYQSWQGAFAVAHAGGLQIDVDFPNVGNWTATAFQYSNSSGTVMNNSGTSGFVDSGGNSWTIRASNEVYENGVDTGSAMLLAFQNVGTDTNIYGYNSGGWNKYNSTTNTWSSISGPPNN